MSSSYWKGPSMSLSSGSVFTVGFFFFFLSFWVFGFVFFSSLITFFKDRVFFTSGLLDKINSYKRK